MNLIIDSQYFPSIIYYKISYNSTHMYFDQFETYQKMGFRNRCSIAGAEGILQLSSPLAGGRDQRTLMRDVRVEERQAWQRQHWRTIHSCYSRSPWFDYYRDELERLFGKPVQFLLDWNLACFEWSLGALGLTPVLSLTDRYEVSYDAGKMMDWRGKILPKNR